MKHRHVYNRESFGDFVTPNSYTVSPDGERTRPAVLVEVSACKCGEFKSKVVKVEEWTKR